MTKYSTCPHCFMRMVQGGLCECGYGTKSKKDMRTSAARKDAAPHRSSYDEKYYRQQRQIALERSQGRCEHCGKVIAYKNSKRVWRMIRRGIGSTDHVIPLRDGGSDSADNQRVLCTPCHNIFDAQKRIRDNFMK